jgi:Raf kinase inhibitor-like YbhB/YbcL family protein
MRPTLGLVLVAVPALVSCTGGTATESILPDDPQTQTIRLNSPAFEEGGTVPKVHTCDGKDTSPPLAWSGVPASARSLALILEDPDGPMGTFTHWILFNLPPDAKELTEGLSHGEQVHIGSNGPSARQGKNGFGKFGYGGPCPPKGNMHRYIFRLYALDQAIDPMQGTSREAFLYAVKGHVVAEGRLTGKFGH